GGSGIAPGVQSVNTDILALVKDIQDRVREVAYLMWESAGRQHGMALEYWLSAEREVITTMQAASDRMMPAQGRDAEEASPDAAPANPPVSASVTPPVTPPVSQASDRVVAATAAAKAVPAPSESPSADADADAEPVPASQASKAVVQATAETAEGAAAAGSTAAAAKAAAKPTRKASTRAKRIPPPAS
ncbi:MAG: DUF2934 domain-containing protein, partial [Rhodospirillales bacterium]|nr:DUF2934 domain-containing protein [Rhodospirillales bacterium]